MVSTEPLPQPDPPLDERPQRRREYSGAGSTLGLAALIALVVGVGIWWLEFRNDGGGAGTEEGFGIIEPASPNVTGKAAAAQTGRLAPNFRLRNLEGQPASLDQFRGRYVLLNFWASWCKPCRTETPSLQALSEEVPALTVIGINQQESRATAAGFADDYAVSYPIVLDSSGEVSQAYRVNRGLPISFLLDRNGVVLEVFIGLLDDTELADLRAKYLSP